MTTRRSLITGLIRLVAAPALVKAKGLMPVVPWRPLLIGDGVHDDTEGLRAFLNGLPTRVSRRIHAGPLRLSGANLVVDGMLTAPNGLSMDGGSIRQHWLYDNELAFEGVDQCGLNVIVKNADGSFPVTRVHTGVTDEQQRFTPFSNYSEFRKAA